MEIQKILTISTCHIKESTAKALDSEDTLGLCVYNKSNYGWFITGIQNIDTSYPYLESELLPNDLAAIINFAKDIGVDVLCLDRDGETLSYLPVYNWYW